LRDASSLTEHPKGACGQQQHNAHDENQPRKLFHSSKDARNRDSFPVGRASGAKNAGACRLVWPTGPIRKLKYGRGASLEL
jgi:hypothetical protein